MSYYRTGAMSLIAWNKNKNEFQGRMISTDQWRPIDLKGDFYHGCCRIRNNLTPVAPFTNMV